jgi:Sulfotransferase family
LIESRCDTRAALFYSALVSRGYDPEAHIDVLPQARLIYVCVPKCASTTIKMVLSAVAGGNAKSFERIHKRRYSGLKSPSQVGLSALYRTVSDSRTLRFSFVRNPYERLVSAWADKFRDRPLVPGDSFIDKYLRFRRQIDVTLPHGPQKTLSFADFVIFASATANRRIDAHWQVQHDILDMPGITLDLVGKVETFGADFDRVLDHLGRYRERAVAWITPQHQSHHEPWPQYYTHTLADHVYRAYERDFDCLGYPRAI